MSRSIGRAVAVNQFFWRKFVDGRKPDELVRGIATSDPSRARPSLSVVHPTHAAMTSRAELRPVVSTKYFIAVFLDLSIPALPCLKLTNDQKGDIPEFRPLIASRSGKAALNFSTTPLPQSPTAACRRCNPWERTLIIHKRSCA